MDFLLRSLDPRIREELRPHSKTIFLGLVCTAVASALAGVVAVFVKLVVQAVQNHNKTELLHLSYGVVILFLVKYFFTREQAFLLSKVGVQMTAGLRQKLFKKFLKLPLGYFNEARSGGLQSVMTNDVNVYQNAVNVLKDSIDGPVKITVGLAIVLYYLWQLAAIVVLFFPVFWWVSQHNSKKMKEAQRRVQEDLGILNATAQETLQGVRIVKAFGAETSFDASYRFLNDQSVASQLVAAKRVATLKPTIELLGAVALALVVILLATTKLGDGLEVPQLTAALFALDSINQGQRNLGSYKQTVASVSAATDKIYRDVLDVPEGDVSLHGDKKPAVLNGHVEFRNVSFAYPDGTQALRDVNFELMPGTSLALVGPSGSGKSTISDLLLRFFDPQQGEILLDGVSLKDIDPGWLRNQIGVVPQQTFLFAGSIEDNIRMGYPSATAEEIAEAALAAHADAFIDLMPQRYDTVLGERGARLSGGEMQRVAIARALVRKPTLLILDEATSALDAMSEKAVQGALDEIMHQRTSLFIAHRLTTAARADRILVLRGGEVIEVGIHQELMAANGAYAAMVRAFGAER